MNQTPNYQLNQWERSDRVLMEDFNADNAKIDAAVAGLAAKVSGKATTSALSALQTVVNGKGNCQIAAGTYTGTGTFGVNAQNKLTFSFKPSLVVITGKGWLAVMIAGMSEAQVYSGGSYATWKLTWSGNSVSWYVSDVKYANSSLGTVADYTQMNLNAATYYYIVLGAKS